MTDLVDQMFPPVHRRWASEYTDFNFWRAPLPEIELPDLRPPSPALSARSDTSGGSRLGRFVGLGRTTSRASSTDARQGDKDQKWGLGDAERRRTTSHPGTVAKTGTVTVRPSSPLTGPAMSAEDLDIISDAEGRMQGELDVDREHRRRMSFDSMPGSFEERQWHGGLDEEDSDEVATQDPFDNEDEDGEEGDDEHDDDDGEDEEPQFDTLATDEMEDTPFL